MKKLNVIYSIVENLTEWSLQKREEDSSKLNVTLCHVSEIVSILVRNQETKVQQSIIDKFLPSFLNSLSVQSDKNPLNNAAANFTKSPHVVSTYFIVFLLLITRNFYRTLNLCKIGNKKRFLKIPCK